MSAKQTRRTLMLIEKELSDLEKKLSYELKKEADKMKKINVIQKSITKNMSSSLLLSKNKQIRDCNNDLVRSANSKAVINKKIADRRKKRIEIMQKLEIEERNEAKALERKQQNILAAYEERVNSLSNQLLQPLEKQNKSQSLYTFKDKEYDVFLSHATEDKKDFADELCKELRNLGISVWYDELEMIWGDSLRSRIDNGLIKSKYGIVIISKDYINKGWTNYELDGLFQREISVTKVILPIWHNITKKEVEMFSPSLAGRLALNSATLTPYEIANELKKY